MTSALVPQPSGPGINVPGMHITGWGSALPEKIVTNDDLAGTMDTNDQWIRDRTGIHERRVGGSTSTLAIESARKAMHRAGVGPDDIDLVVLATTTPDQQIPATAVTIQAELGLTCGAIDLNAACSGFVYGLVTATGFTRMGFRRILLIGADSLSRLTDWTDRGTAILFADGGGAVVIETTDGTDAPDSLLGWDLGADGNARHILDCDHGGLLRMEGREVFKRAVRAVVDSATIALDRAGLTAADIDWFIPHQANIRIMESASNRLGIPMDKVASVIHYTGNTSAGSIPLALVDYLERDLIKPGQLLLLSGFGAGMTWASAVLRWQP
jgi:3-oxoacyl-[acyl-carrier-protein] synthase-3